MNVMEEGNHRNLEGFAMTKKATTMESASSTFCVPIDADLQTDRAEKLFDVERRMSSGELETVESIENTAALILADLPMLKKI